jgi:hypothetical protein
MLQMKIELAEPREEHNERPCRKQAEYPIRILRSSLWWTMPIGNITKISDLLAQKTQADYGGYLLKK